MRIVGKNAYQDTVLALSRFGLGPRPGEWRSVQNDPRGWVLSQIDGIPDTVPEFAERPTTERIVGEINVAGFRQEGEPLPPQLETIAAEFSAQSLEEVPDYGFDDVMARWRQAALTTTPVIERLSRFYFNHLTVSTNADNVQRIAGGYDREAIRPHVQGRFSDMVLASAKHPAMLNYLDNLDSVGPNSPLAMYTGQSFNENYARELMELHTISVRGGYTQDDVEELSLALTGLYVPNWAYEDVIPGRYFFDEERHEPGARTIMGRTYDQPGEEQANAVIRDLAAMPQTANFLATKLVRHYINDQPDPVDVATVERAFLDSDGHLPSVHRALFTLDSAWRPGFYKARSSEDFVVALARAFEDDRLFQGDSLVRNVNWILGQFPYRPPGPNGWPDVAAVWLSGQNMARRMEIAQWASYYMGGQGQSALAYMKNLYGPGLSFPTRRAIALADEENGAGYAVAFASREMLMY